MAKISRVKQLLFGSTGNVSFFGEPGSLPAGTKVNTKDPATIQSLGAFLTGLSAIVKSGTYKVAMEDLNSLFLLAFYQISYLMQAGIPEYDATTTYYTGSFCQVSGVIYVSLVDDNLNNTPASSPASWQSQQYVALTGNQTVAGIKNFSSSPVVPAPTTDLQAATKKYVDDKVAAAGFGAREAKVVGTIYQAATDGCVTVVGTDDGDNIIRGYADGNASPSTLRAVDHSFVDQAPVCAIEFDVRKGEYWVATSSRAGLASVTWMPKGV